MSQSQEILRAGLRSLFALSILQVAVCQLSSRISSNLSYNMTEFSKETLVTYGHDIPLNLFKIETKQETSPKLDNISLEISAPMEILLMGTFRLAENIDNSSKILPFEERRSGETTEAHFLFQGTVEQLNSVLRSLSFMRNVTVDATVDFQVYYSIFDSNDSSKKDTITQRLVCLKGLKIEVLETRTSLAVYQGRSFAYDLLAVMDNKEVLSALSIRMHPSSALAGFFTVNMSKGLVWVEGLAESSSGDPKLDQGNPYRLSFAVRDSVTGVDSESFTFYLQVESRGLDQSQKLKLVFLTGVLFALVIVLVCCAVAAFKRDKKQLKEEVKQVIQQENAPENVLTKSILEWNKEATSTRDQSHKESLLYNPYEKFSLKKKHQEHRNRDKYGQIVSSGSHVNTSRSAGQSNFSLKGRKVELADRNPGPRLELEEDQRQGQITNGSRLEFSREDISQFPAKDLEFGDDFSQIAGARHEQDEEEGRHDIDPRLEDIILKEF